MAVCPECQEMVQVPDGVMTAEILVCAECSSELEVVTASPVMLALAPEVAEDWGE